MKRQLFDIADSPIGTGRGPISGRSRQCYELAKLILTGNYVPVVGEGKARWNNVHVHDLSQVYLLLAERAIAGGHDSEIWGAKGYYLTENGEHNCKIPLHHRSSIFNC